MNALLKEEIQEEGDFVLDEKAKSVVLTQEGVAKAENISPWTTFPIPKIWNCNIISTML